MTNDQTNLVLEHLRHIRAKVDRTAEDVQDLNVRMTALEERMIFLEKGLAAVYEAIAGTNRRLDRMDERVTRIERRLELTEA